MTVLTSTQGGQPFTYEDLEATPDDGCRREVIGGSLIVTPSPLGGHQSVTLSLAVVLRAAETPQTKVMVAPLDWRLPDGGSVQPDVMVIRRQDYDPEARISPSATPLLVVEVLSPSNAAYDRTLKRELYQSMAVPAYWIVDPRAPSILALRLSDGLYSAEAEVSEGTFTTDWPFTVQVRIAELAQ